MFHVAIVDPALIPAIILGRKTIESRLARVRALPHNRVARGDTIYFKARGGPILCVCTVERVQTLDNLRPADIRRIRDALNHRIGADAAYWRRKRTARHATLIWLGSPRPVHATLDHARIIAGTPRSAWMTLAAPLERAASSSPAQRRKAG